MWPGALRKLRRAGRFVIISAALAIAVPGIPCVAVDSAAGTGDSAPGGVRCSGPRTEIDPSALPNTVQVSPSVWSGGQPDGVRGFSALRDMGIRTIISVDGIRPDVNAAREHGLRYVHLPVGYDGVSTHRAEELARAILDLPRPIYIHCHHGRHRSPAAAAVGCITAGLISQDKGIDVLRRAGTAPGYRGLWNSVRSTVPVRRQDLDRLVVEFPAAVEPSPLVASMNQLETGMAHVELLSMKRLTTISPRQLQHARHQALLLREQFTELLRVDPEPSRPQGFRTLLQESQAQAAVLESLLQPATVTPITEERQDRLQTAVRNIRRRCSECHRRYRD